MGYQQGRICYPTEADATNALMTQVVPTIDKDGVLHHPVFNVMTVYVMAAIFAVRAIISIISTLKEYPTE